MTTQTLSRAQARRIALAAQGFLDPVHASPTMRTLTRTVARTGVLQVDSVNVLARAHLMPLYSRMGPYDAALLERAASGREQRRLVEYWAHVQALMPVDLWPHLRFRMETYRAERGKWGFTADPTLEPAVLDAVRAAGAGHRPRPRRRVQRPAHQGALGLELVGGPQGARLPVPGR